MKKGLAYRFLKPPGQPFCLLYKDKNLFQEDSLKINPKVIFHLQ